MKRDPAGLRLGVVMLDGDYVVEKRDFSDPFDAPPHLALPAGYMNQPDFWPVPTAFAVAAGATVRELFNGTSAALEGVVAAVDRLAQHCDLIVGDCGYMYWVVERSLLKADTPALLSGLQLLPSALESTCRPVGVLTASRAATEEMLAGHPQRSRMRIVGLDQQPGWAALTRDDWITLHPAVEQLRAELFDVCLHERQAGAFADVGALVLECTVLPRFRTELSTALALPTWDIAAVAKTLLGA